MTATRAALLELATRVEQASGPDRDLDKEIASAAGWQRPHAVLWKSPAGEWLNWQPYFSGSIDAAMSLVPEGWRFSVDNLNRAGPIAICEPDRGAYVRSEGTTPALALCAAALRALAAEAPQ